MRGWLLINACLSLTVMYTEADAFWVVLEPGRSEEGERGRDCGARSSWHQPC